MLNRFIQATFVLTRQKASRSAAWLHGARDAVNGFMKTAHHTVMILGIIAIAALGAMFVNPDLADDLLTLSPFAQAEENDEATSPVAQADLPVLSSTQNAAANKADKLAVNTRQQQWVTTWLSKRYRVASDATNMLVSAAYSTAREIKLDPLLILSVMAIESGFNPFAESPVGAQGLMQVMSKVHHDKFEDLGGVKAALNPIANIKVGSLILKDYVKRGGSVEAGLKMYVGAGAMASDSGYGARVLAEYRRLKDVSMGKHVPTFSTSTVPKQRQKEESAESEPSESASNDELTKAQQLAAL